MKMREALAEARKVIKAMGGYWATVTLPIIDAALSEPVRNCDALSADDVKSRFKERMASSDMGLIGENIVEVVSGVVDFLYATEEGGAK